MYLRSPLVHICTFQLPSTHVIPPHFLFQEFCDLVASRRLDFLQSCLSPLIWSTSSPFAAFITTRCSKTVLPSLLHEQYPLLSVHNWLKTHAGASSSTITTAPELVLISFLIRSIFGCSTLKSMANWLVAHLLNHLHPQQLTVRECRPTTLTQAHDQRTFRAGGDVVFSNLRRPLPDGNDQTLDGVFHR